MLFIHCFFMHIYIYIYIYIYITTLILTFITINIILMVINNEYQNANQKKSAAGLTVFFKVRLA